MHTGYVFYLVAIPAVLIAAVSKGGFGSGAGFVSAPMLALVMEPRQAVGLLLYSKFLFPFEVASVLLLVAIVGAVALSRRHLAMGADRDESTEEVP